jgi:diguanylate cyclase (GGDEF)-like protein
VKSIHSLHASSLSLLVLFSFFVFTPLHVEAKEKIVLQLKWTHAFQFAGYYAAKELGYYRDAGLDVDIREAGPGINPVEQVVSGEAHYGVGNSSLLLARQAGEPVVVIGVIFQHSPSILISKQQSSLKGLVGKHVMIEPNSGELFAYLQREGVPSDSIEQVKHTYQIDELVSGKVDAISAYSSYEPYFLKQAGFHYQIFTPRESGIDFYGDNLFTSERELASNPERLEAFRAASMRGWQYAMKHKEEAISLVLKNYAPQLTRDFLRFESQSMMDLMRTDLVNVGHMIPGRWQHIMSVYASLGLYVSLGHIKDKNLLDGFLYYPKHTLEDLLRENVWSLALYFMAFILLLVGLHALNLRRVVHHRTKELEKLNLELHKFSFSDGLTGASNRRMFDQALEREWGRAQRNHSALSLIMIDIDFFKKYNDHYGHQQGDDCLRQVVQALKHVAKRPTDMIARYGGEEFVFLIPETDAEHVIKMAEKCCRVVLELQIPHVESAACNVVTISAGICTVKPAANVPSSSLILATDKLLYAAKKNGRNRIEHS